MVGRYLPTRFAEQNVTMRCHFMQKKHLGGIPMKQPNKLLPVLLTLALALSVSAMAASSGTYGDNLTWTLDDAGKLTISGIGAMEECFVPWYGLRDSVKTVVIENGVTSIGKQVFYSCESLTSVTIPNSVTSIGSEAFYNCEKLESVTIPNSVKSIGGYAFSFCESLTSVTIPSSVTSIGDGAFSACTSLTQISVASGNANYSSENGILFSKDKSKLIQYPAGKTEISYTIPNSVTGIWGGAFFACESLKSVTIPDSVTSIGDRAFSSCTSLKSVMIPDSVTDIGENAFSYCEGLASVTIGNGVTSIGGVAFYGCESLTSVTIPKGMEYIGYQAFDGCTSLADVYYAGSEAQWKSEVHIDSRNAPLTSAAIHYNSTAATRGTCGDNLTWTLDDADTLTISGTGAMDDYLSTSGVPWYGSRDSIKSVVISGATSIGNGAFSGCASLASVTIPDGVTSIGSGAFYGCASLASVTIPDGVTSIGNEAFKGCASLESVTIPDGVTSIGNGVFTGCASLTQISVANGNESFISENGILFTIDQSTLIRYPAGKKETSYTIPNSVTSIEDGAFSGCASLTQIGVESDSFVSENGILFTNDQSTLIQYPAGKKETSYTIPDSVTGVGKFAFSGCTSLESVTIPSSVTGVGDAAFDRCTSLADVHYTGSEEQWAAVSIGDDNDLLTSATIHCNSCGSCGDNLTWMLDDAGTLTISGTGAMDDYLSTSDVPWYGSRGSIKTVVISGATSIGNGAFSGCASLASVTIPDSVTSIGEGPFSACTSLTQISVASGNENY
ncbi:MAG: leucine-rich repeat domain-containing protein, partial [Ruminococcaceae bacterium]|nr:leucine-rich repeat domain-containing protein [Oscillospiraceae bacterium]